MIGIVVSQADTASVNIWDEMQECVDWEEREDHNREPVEGGGTVYLHGDFEVRTFDGLHLYLDDPSDAFEQPTLLVFVSRHAGETGRLLTAHFPGNVGDAAYGGSPGEFPPAAPHALSVIYESLSKHAPADYDVGIECTHHGPSDVRIPAMFVELGSDMDAWDDPEGAAAVAKAVLELEGIPQHRDRTVVGVGGGHYAPKFQRIIESTDWDVGHIAADWALEEIGALRAQVSRIETALRMSKSDIVVFDGNHPALADRVRTEEVRIASETWLHETSGIPRDAIDAIETAFGRIEDGVRIGARASDTTIDGAVYELSEDLLALLRGVDETAMRTAISTHTVAYDTRENGNRLDGRLYLRGKDEFDELVDALLDILHQSHEVVDRDGHSLTVSRSTFDPDKARQLGVPEGPVFGQLASGEAVTIDGKTITPGDVIVETRERVDITTN